MSAEAIGFVLVGLLAGSVNVLARILFNYVVPYEIAIVLAFPFALTVAFVLNRWLVFGATGGQARTQYFRFAAVNVLALAQVWLISTTLARLIFPAIAFRWHADTVAHIVGVASPVVTSFIAYRYFVFARPNAVHAEHRGWTRTQTSANKPALATNLSWPLATFAVVTATYFGSIVAADIEQNPLVRLAEMTSALPVVMASCLVAWWVRFLRWRLLLATEGFRISLGRGFLIYLAGFAFTASPGKSGELIRLRYTINLGVPHSLGVAAFVYERALDLIVLLLLAALIAGKADGFAIAGLFVLLVIGCIALVANAVRLRLLMLRKIRGKGLRTSARWLRILLSGISGTVRFLTPSCLASALLLGVIAWTIQSAGSAVALMQLGVVIPWWAVLAVPAAAMLMGAASMMPGGIGTTEAAMVFILTRFGVDLGLAVLGAVAMRLGSLWFAILLGFGAMLWLENECRAKESRVGERPH